MTVEEMLTLLMQQVAVLTEKVDRLSGYASNPTPLPSAPLPTAKPVMEPFNKDKEPNFSAGVCTTDFWMQGRLGCKHGALESHYTVAKTIMGILGGEAVEHSVIVPVAPNLPWSAALKKVGDPEVMWLDGESYVFDPAEDVQSRYVKYRAAGSPNRNSRGRYDNNGALVAADAWEGRKN